MGQFLMIIVSAVFINNFVVVQFLGICPFLGVSKDFKSALGMGLAVTFVMTLTCLITYPVYTFILVPLGLEFMEIIVFIFIIASIVQMIEMTLKKAGEDRVADYSLRKEHIDKAQTEARKALKEYAEVGSVEYNLELAKQYAEYMLSRIAN